MEGYNRDDAFAFINNNIKKSDHKAFSPSELESLLKLAIEADLAFMEETGVLKDGVAGDTYYDDDDAFEYIDQYLCRMTGANEEKSMHIASLVDAYMELQESYMEQAGLIDWD